MDELSINKPSRETTFETHKKEPHLHSADISNHKEDDPMKLAKKAFVLVVLLTLQLTCFCLCSAQAATLTLPAELQEIEAGAFYGATMLDEVALPSGIQRIGSLAFANSSLTKINLPESLDYIADDAFLRTNLETVTVEAGTYACDWAVAHGYIAVPSAPKQNAPTPSGNSITVSWSPAKGATSYTVYYGKSSYFSNAEPIIAGDVTSTTINNLAYKTTYYTWVTASNAAGESKQSSRMYVTTPEELPEVPVQNAPTVSGNKITVSWSKAERATSYKVYYGTSKNIADATAVSGGSGTSKAITGLKYDTTYYIWVKAINSAGESGESAREKITTPEAIPTAPVQNELTASGNSITVSWNPVEGATSYTVYYGTSTYVSNAQSIIAGDVTSTTINNLAYKKTYYTWVTATNSAGESDKSNRKNIATQEELPDAPVQNAPTASGNSITVSWSKAAGATSYTVYYNTSDSITDAEAVSAGSTTSKTITGLEYEKTYYIWVTASNSAGESEKSNSEIITTGGPAIDISSVQLTETSVTLEVGETHTLTASPIPSNASVKSTTWSSSKTSVAKVSSTGIITAVAEGTATITAKMTSSEGTVKTATCTVNVIPTVIDITGVQLNKTSVTLKVGETDTLIASPIPSNASVKSTTWSSNKTSVAKVSSTGKITAVAKGTATITATMTSSEGTVKTATCTVTVVPDQVKFLTTPNVTGGQCAGDEYTVEFDTTTNAYYVVVCYKDSSGTHEKADKFYASQYGTAYSSKISWKFKYNFESTGNSDTRTVILRCYDASGKCDTETSNEFTCKPEGPVFTVNLPDMTVRIGESPIINATVSVSGGSGYVGWVIMAAYGYSDSGMSDNFSGHNKSSITTGGYAAYRIDTSKAPWNTPGTYTVRLWVTDSNGNGPTTGTDADGASASMTVIITPASNDLTAKINKARSLFTDGKYWCHTPGASFTRYTLSNTACTCIYRHGQSRQGAGSHPVLDGSCGCNYYYGIQCFGYANAIANEVFGSPAEDANGNAMSNWTKVSGSSHVNELKVGDVIRIDPGHSAFITKVTESTIYVTQCNWTVNDKIEWDYAFSKTSLSASGSYTLRYYLRHSSMK